MYFDSSLNEISTHSLDKIFIELIRLYCDYNDINYDIKLIFFKNF